MTLEKRIQLCNELTPAEQQLANYILKNRSQLETVTISQLAQLTFFLYPVFTVSVKTWSAGI